MKRARRFLGLGIVVGASALTVPTTAWAQDGLDTGDTAWILVSTALVLFMTIPGLALFYGGLVRTKNVLSVLMQCFVLTALVTVIWLVAGYSLAFDTSGMVEGTVNINSFIGSLNKVFLHGVAPDALWGSIPEVLFFMFQLTFAIITPASGFIGPEGAIVIGATSGVVCWWAATQLKNKLGYDDALDVLGVHGVGGLVGVLLVAVFASPTFGGNQEGLDIGAQLKTQSIAAVITVAWTLVGTYIALKVASIVGLRVHADDEEAGLDLTQHTERGYDL